MYAGFANEVGEAFRSLVHVNVVRASYGVASDYVLADKYNKSIKMYRVGKCAHTHTVVQWYRRYNCRMTNSNPHRSS